MDKLNALTIEDALLDISMDDRGEWVADLNIRFGIDKREIVRMFAREPIVRCRDCRYFDSRPNYQLCRRDMSCDEIAVYAEPDGFCAWGERKVER